jgi:cytidine deaminase
MLTDEMRKKLIKMASDARQNAYAPYSNYAVGAALLAKSGKIYTGINIENAAFPTSICAERVALFKAVSEGEREFDAIAVVTFNGGTPCGACRQALSEFGLDTKVIIADDRLNLSNEFTLSELLPGAFRPHDLVKSEIEQK